MSQEIADPAALRALRTKLNLSQEQLAERLDVSFATVNRWESGKTKPQRAQVETLQKLIAESQEIEPAAAPRRRRGVAKSAVLGTKSMEQMLWDAACAIRGEKDAPKFKDYILPLLFLKRLSDVFEDELKRLAEEYGDAQRRRNRRSAIIASCAFMFRRKRAGPSSPAAKLSIGPTEKRRSSANI